MSDSESRQLTSMQRTLERIEHCVIGDPAAGQIGLVARVNDHAKRLKRLERYCLYLVSAGAVLVGMYRVLTDWFPKR